MSFARKSGCIDVQKDDEKIDVGNSLGLAAPRGGGFSLATCLCFWLHMCEDGVRHQKRVFTTMANGGYVWEGKGQGNWFGRANHSCTFSRTMKPDSDLRETKPLLV